MKRLITIFLLFALCTSCKQKKDNPNSAGYQSTGTTDFSITFAQNDQFYRLLQDSLIFGSSAKATLTEINGDEALEIKTISEFSDVFIDLEGLFGHPIDFGKARYMSLRLLVPKTSWITALKFNFKDDNGNFGGCEEIANNFYGHYDQWIDVWVDMRRITPGFKNWHGKENPLPRTRYLSFNPYNAHQADSSSIYIHSIALRSEKPMGNFVEALTSRPRIAPNNPYTITFDEDELLQKQMAIRAFESTYQAMGRNIAGNSSMAIRLMGKESNKHLAFLPILDKLTGDPVDFTKVKRLKFSYYLTDDSAEFDGAELFLADKHWNSVLHQERAYSHFKKGKWMDAVIELKDLNLELVRGTGPVLPNVYEIRLGLNYRPNQKNIEMWIDNFGWE